MRYEKRRAELQALIADPRSDYHNYTQALDDPDEYRSKGALILPEDAKWENIVREARRDDIKTHLDGILETMEDTYPDKLKGLLPRIYAGSNMDAENVRGLINLFSKDIFKEDHGAEDVLGRIYEYFIGEFASSEGKRSGEYFTPLSIVRTLVAMLEPKQGIVFDPCCGSGGMFVQSDVFTDHSGQLAFYGQESKDFTYRPCRMNLFIHGIDGNIQLGNSHSDDKHDTLKADYVLANPPFNDGSKGVNGWGADKITADDPRRKISEDTMPLAPRNANTMWIMHFLSHLKVGGIAGFVMSQGELSNGETARLTVRKALVEADYVDCVVQLTGQLFANTQIPCALWFLSKNGDGRNGFRKRKGEVLFIDGRKLGTLIPGSRKQKELSTEDIERIAAVYREFKYSGAPEKVSGFCSTAPSEEILQKRFALNPGRYVGTEENDENGISFEERFPQLRVRIFEQFSESNELQGQITNLLDEIL